jgi:hypothetical protein
MEDLNQSPFAYRVPIHREETKAMGDECELLFCSSALKVFNVSLLKRTLN